MGSLNFRLLGFPVQVQPSFWLLAVLAATTAGPWQRSLAMIAVVLVSILAHELGHATLARAYGQQPVIALHMMGGVTSWVPTHDIGRARSMLVTVAGPLGGFALGLFALAIAVGTAGQSRDELEPGSILLWTIDRLCVVNFFWSAINLLPVLPFDGGQLLALALGRSRRTLAATLSLIFGLICGVVLWSGGYPLAAAVFWLGGITSYAATRRRLAPEAPADVSAGWDGVIAQTRSALDAGKLGEARALARTVHRNAPSATQRQRGLELLGWATLMQGDLEELRGLPAALEPGAEPDPVLWASIDEALGEAPRGVERLTAARRAGDRRPELAALEVRLLLKSGRPGAAASLTGEILDDIPANEARRVAGEALDGGAALEAAELWQRLFLVERAGADAYHAARAYARGRRPEIAVRALADAVAAGYPDVADHARRDADLATLVGDPSFEAALAGTGAAADTA